MLRLEVEVVGRVVAQPLPPVRADAVHGLVGNLHQGQIPVPLATVSTEEKLLRLVGSARTGGSVVPKALIGRESVHAPPQNAPQAQDGAHLTVEEVGADELGHDCSEVRRSRVGKLKLRPPVVGAARRPYLARRPWQSPCPLHGIVAVDVVLVVTAEEAGHELAVRPVPPAHILDHIQEPAFRQPGAFFTEPVGPFVVRRAFQDDRELAVDIGAVYVGAEHDAIPHRGFDIGLKRCGIHALPFGGSYAQRGSSGSQRRNSGVPEAASSSRVRNHFSAQRPGSWSSLSGFDRLRAMNPGNHARPVACPTGL